MTTTTTTIKKMIPDVKEKEIKINPFEEYVLVHIHLPLPTEEKVVVGFNRMNLSIHQLVNIHPIHPRQTCMSNKKDK